MLRYLRSSTRSRTQPKWVKIAASTCSFWPVGQPSTLCKRSCGGDIRVAAKAGQSQAKWSHVGTLPDAHHLRSWCGVIKQAREWVLEDWYVWRASLALASWKTLPCTAVASRRPLDKNCWNCCLRYFGWLLDVVDIGFVWKTNASNSNGLSRWDGNFGVCLIFRHTQITCIVGCITGWKKITCFSLSHRPVLISTQNCRLISPKKCKWNLVSLVP